MCLLLESIYWKDGISELLDLHLKRMNNSRKELFNIDYPITIPADLKPPSDFEKKWKLRITYARDIEKTEWIRYKKSVPKKILVLDPGPIDYKYKYANRPAFENLKASHPDFDDFILLRENSLTDGSYSNIVLKFGNKWLTPSTPLLNGVRRESLLQRGKITEHPLSRKDLLKADEIRLINAMIPLGDGIIIKREQLFFLNKKS